MEYFQITLKSGTTVNVDSSQSVDDYKIWLAGDCGNIRGAEFRRHETTWGLHAYALGPIWIAFEAIEVLEPKEE